MSQITGTTRVPSPRAAADGGLDAVDAAIIDACVALRLPTVRDNYAEIVENALRQKANYRGFLLELLTSECEHREERRKERLVRGANFHRPKRIEDFDYGANHNVQPEEVNALTDPSWVLSGQPLCLIGGSGTGKSHLLIGIGTAIAEAGLKVRYTTTAGLVNELIEAQHDKQLTRTIHKYGRYDLLCLDEFGYLNLDKTGAKLLFQVFTEREERRSIAVASNAPFGEWNKTFTDERLCGAIVDRLTFKGHVIETGHDSYRLMTTLAEREAA